MKDLSTLSYFLGLEVTLSYNGYYLSQAKYASDLLSKAGITDNKIVSTLLEYNVKLTPLDGEPICDVTRYRQLVSSLIYLTVTCLDISLAMGMVSKFMDALHFVHYAVVLRILRNVKGLLYHGLHHSFRSSLKLHAYSDVDWAGDQTNRCSITSFYFLLGTSLISWRSKKQDVVSHSSTEAEYRALADTTCELVWFRWLLADMDAPQPTVIPLYCDNRSAIYIAHNNIFHERTKHIEIDYYITHQHLKKGNLKLFSISFANQPTDIFTKSHLPGCLRDLISKLQLASSLPPQV
ncbi:uncharacterized mitochondrial protein AtMg00810-like [Quercus suber]|uniref:uncharacterized mitochondrial protein AtMg00810-like n=1 Tax=Quercus suber TaxID=58331 RepID=UPI0032E0244D